VSLESLDGSGRATTERPSMKMDFLRREPSAATLTPRDQEIGLFRTEGIRKQMLPMDGMDNKRATLFCEGNAGAKSIAGTEF